MPAWVIEMPTCLPARTAWPSQNEVPVTTTPNPSITAVSTAILAAISARRSGTAAKVTLASPDAYSPTRVIAPRVPATSSSVMPALLVNTSPNEPKGRNWARMAAGYCDQFWTSASAASKLSTTTPTAASRKPQRMERMDQSLNHSPARRSRACGGGPCTGGRSAGAMAEAESRAVIAGLLRGIRRCRR